MVYINALNVWGILSANLTPMSMTIDHSHSLLSHTIAYINRIVNRISYRGPFVMRSSLLILGIGNPVLL